MLRLSSHIEIQTDKELVKLDFLNEVEFDTSWENLTDQGRLIIPRKLKYKNQPIVAGTNALFKRGQKINISLGYDGNLKKVFSGYISDVNPKLPIEIYFQDEFWPLKQKIVPNKTWRQLSLNELMAYIMQGTGVKYRTMGDANLTESQSSIASHPKSKLYKNPQLPQFMVENSTVAQVLDYLRRDYGLYSFYRDGTLYTGLPYVPELRKDQTFKFGTNIISDNLIYRRIDDVKVRVHAISVTPGKKKLEAFAGDPDGNLITTKRPGLNQDDLQRLANTILDLNKYEGFTGEFETFGEPFVNHGDGCVFVDPKLPERNGTYLIKSVKYKFGVTGYRQLIELGPKIA